MPVVGVEPTRVISTRDFEFLSSSSIWCHPVISSDIWFPLCKGKIHASTNNNLKYPRFFDAFFLYSVFSVWTTQMEIGGMFRRDVRNPASTNLQNSTHTREFLVQTRKITKRILSPPRLPFRHTGIFYFTDNIVIIADFSPKIKMQLTTHQISANFLSPFGPRACILRETTSYPKECSL